MTPGTYTLRLCLNCKGKISDYGVGSGNSFGARYWTDGKCEAPMLPNEPDLVKCPHCSKLIWISEQPELDEDESSLFLVCHHALDAPEPLLLELTDYEKLLSRRLGNREKELDARIRAWWKGNDPYRERERSTQLSAFETRNLRSLICLLRNEAADDLLMKAEAHRELGEFETALALLSSRPQYDAVSACIFELATMRIASVRNIPSV